MFSPFYKDYNQQVTQQVTHLNGFETRQSGCTHMRKGNHSIEPKKPGRKPTDVLVDLKTVYVPLPSDKVAAWRASLSLLVDWVVDDFLLNPDEKSNGDRTHEK